MLLRVFFVCQNYLNAGLPAKSFTPPPDACLFQDPGTLFVQAEPAVSTVRRLAGVALVAPPLLLFLLNWDSPTSRHFLEHFLAFLDGILTKLVSS